MRLVETKERLVLPLKDLGLFMVEFADLKITNTQEETEGSKVKRFFNPLKTEKKEPLTSLIRIILNFRSFFENSATSGIRTHDPRHPSRVTGPVDHTLTGNRRLWRHFICAVTFDLEFSQIQLQ